MVDSSITVKLSTAR